MLDIRFALKSVELGIQLKTALDPPLNFPLCPESEGSANPLLNGLLKCLRPLLHELIPVFKNLKNSIHTG